jgi:hypothetical protein
MGERATRPQIAEDCGPPNSRFGCRVFVRINSDDNQPDYGFQSTLANNLPVGEACVVASRGPMGVIWLHGFTQEFVPIESDLDCGNY